MSKNIPENPQNMQTNNTNVSLMAQLSLSGISLEEVLKYKKTKQNKSVYNKKYYEKITKPKKEKERKELDLLREKVLELENYIQSLDIDKINEVMSIQKQKIDEQGYVISQLQKKCNELTRNLEEAEKKLGHYMISSNKPQDNNF